MQDTEHSGHRSKPSRSMSFPCPRQLPVKGILAQPGNTGNTEDLEHLLERRNSSRKSIQTEFFRNPFKTRSESNEDGGWQEIASESETSCALWRCLSPQLESLPCSVCLWPLTSQLALECIPHNGAIILSKASLLRACC